MKFLKKKLTIALLFTVIFCFPTVLFAQDPIDPCTDPFEYCPIDDNVIILIAAVILIAGYKAYSTYRKLSLN